MPGVYTIRSLSFTRRPDQRPRKIGKCSSTLGLFVVAVFDGEPGAVEVGAGPSVASGGIVAEEHGSGIARLGILRVRADGKRRRKRHPDIVRGRAHRRECRHDLPVLDSVSQRLGKVAVCKAAVAGEQHGASRERNVVVQRVRDYRHVELDLDDVAKLPVAFDHEIAPCPNTVKHIAVQLHRRLRAPRGDAQPPARFTSSFTMSSAVRIAA